MPRDYIDDLISKYVSPGGGKEKLYAAAERAKIPKDIADDYYDVIYNVESGASHYDKNGKVKLSPYNPKVKQRAVGIGQLLPTTAAKYGLDPYDEDQNLEAGLREFNSFGNDPVGRRIGYFGGQGAFNKYVKTGKIPKGGDGYTTFQQYIDKSMKKPVNGKPISDNIDNLISKYVVPQIPPQTETTVKGQQPLRVGVSQQPEQTQQPVIQETQPQTATPAQQQVQQPTVQQPQGVKASKEAVQFAKRYHVTGTPEQIEDLYNRYNQKDQQAIEFIEGQKKAIADYNAKAAGQRKQQSQRRQPLSKIGYQDIQWHLGLNQTQFDSLPEAQRRKAADLVAWAVQNDEKKKAQGQAIPQPSSGYQREMRNQAGLSKVRFTKPEDTNAYRQAIAQGYNREQALAIASGNASQPQPLIAKRSNYGTGGIVQRQIPNLGIDPRRAVPTPSEQKVVSTPTIEQAIASQSPELKQGFQSYLQEQDTLRQNLKNQVKESIYASRRQAQQSGVIDTSYTNSQFYGMSDADIDKYADTEANNQYNKLVEAQQQVNDIKFNPKSAEELNRRIGILDSVRDAFNVSPVIPQGAKEAVNSLLVQGFGGSVGRLADKVVGLTDFATLPGLLIKEITGRETNPLRILGIDKQIAISKLALSETKAEGTVNEIAAIIGGTPLDLATLVGTTYITGSPVAAFAINSGTEAKGRGAGLKEVARETAKGALMGAIFEGSKPIGDIASSLVSSIPKVGKLISLPAGYASRVGTVGIGTYSLERADGASKEDATRSAIVNMIFVALPASSYKQATKRVAEGLIDVGIEPEKVFDASAKILKYRKAVFRSPDNRVLVFYGDPQRAKGFGKFESLENQLKGTKPDEIVDLTTEQFENLATNAGMRPFLGFAGQPKQLTGQVLPSEKSQGGGAYDLNQVTPQGDVPSLAKTGVVNEGTAAPVIQPEQRVGETKETIEAQNEAALDINNPRIAVIQFKDKATPKAAHGLIRVEVKGYDEVVDYNPLKGFSRNEIEDAIREGRTNELKGAVASEEEGRAGANPQLVVGRNKEGVEVSADIVPDETFVPAQEELTKRQVGETGTVETKPLAEGEPQIVQERRAEIDKETSTPFDVTDATTLEEVAAWEKQLTEAVNQNYPKSSDAKTKVLNKIKSMANAQRQALAVKGIAPKVPPTTPQVEPQSGVSIWLGIGKDYIQRAIDKGEPFYTFADKEGNITPDKMQNFERAAKELGYELTNKKYNKNSDTLQWDVKRLSEGIAPEVPPTTPQSEIPSDVDLQKRQIIREKQESVKSTERLSAQPESERVTKTLLDIPSKVTSKQVAQVAKIALEPVESPLSKIVFGNEQLIEKQNAVYTTTTKRGKEYTFDLYRYKLTDGRERVILSADDPEVLIDAGAVIRFEKNGVVIEAIHAGETGFSGLGGILVRHIRKIYGNVIADVDAPLSNAGRRATEKLAKKEATLTPPKQEAAKPTEGVTPSIPAFEDLTPKQQKQVNDVRKEESVRLKTLDDFEEPTETSIKDGNTFDLIRGNVYDVNAPLGQAKNIQGIGIEKALPSMFGNSDAKVVANISRQITEYEKELSALSSQNTFEAFARKRFINGQLESLRDMREKHQKRVDIEMQSQKEAEELGLIYLTSQKETAKTYAEQLTNLSQGLLGERAIPSVNYDKVTVTPKKIFDLTKLTDAEGNLDNPTTLRAIESVIGISPDLLPDNPHYAFQMFRGRNAKPTVDALRAKGYDLVRFNESGQDNFIVLDKSIIGKPTETATSVEAKAQEAVSEKQEAKAKEPTVAEKTTVEKPAPKSIKAKKKLTLTQKYEQAQGFIGRKYSSLGKVSTILDVKKDGGSLQYTVRDEEDGRVHTHNTPIEEKQLLPEEKPTGAKVTGEMPHTQEAKPQDTVASIENELAEQGIAGNQAEVRKQVLETAKERGVTLTKAEEAELKRVRVKAKQVKTKTEEGKEPQPPFTDTELEKFRKEATVLRPQIFTKTDVRRKKINPKIEARWNELTEASSKWTDYLKAKQQYDKNKSYNETLPQAQKDLAEFNEKFPFKDGDELTLDYKPPKEDKAEVHKVIFEGTEIQRTPSDYAVAVAKFRTWAGSDFELFTTNFTAKSAWTIREEGDVELVEAQEEKPSVPSRIEKYKEDEDFEGRLNEDVLLSQFTPEEEAGAKENEIEEARKEWLEKGTDSKYFKEWFKDSKVVDGNGKPLVVYHGTPNEFFDVFDTGRINETAEGQGLYFTDKKSIAKGYGEGGYLFEVYLSIEKPLDFYKKTISRKDFEKFIRKLDPDGTGFLTNYGDVDYDGYNKVLREAIENEYDGADTDVDLIGSIRNTGENFDELSKALKESLGYDGIIVQPEWGGKQTVYVAFAPTQIKSATGNRGTFSNVESSILLSQFTPEETIRMERAARKEYDELTPDVKVEKGKFKATIKLNIEGQEIIRRALHTVEIKRGKMKLGDKEIHKKFLAAFLKPQIIDTPGEASDLIRVLGDTANAMKSKGYSKAEVAEIEKLATLVRDTAKENHGTVIFYVYPSEVPHEYVHRAEYLASGAAKLQDMYRPEDYERLMTKPVAQGGVSDLLKTAHEKSVKLSKYDWNTQKPVILAEAKAEAANGNWAQLGWSLQDAENFFMAEARAFVRRNGRKILEHLEDVKEYGAIKAYIAATERVASEMETGRRTAQEDAAERATGDAGGTDITRGVEKGVARETEGSASGGIKAGLEVTDTPEKLAKEKAEGEAPKGMKERGLAKTARKAGVGDVSEEARFYEVRPQSKTQAEAFDFIRRNGVENSIEYVRNARELTAEVSGVGVELLKGLARESMTADTQAKRDAYTKGSQDLLDALAIKGTEAGQFINYFNTLVKESPEGAIAWIERQANKYGGSLSDEEKLNTYTKALEYKASAEVLDKIKELETKIADKETQFEDEIKAANAEINRLSEEVQKTRAKFTTARVDKAEFEKLQKQVEKLEEQKKEAYRVRDNAKAQMRNWKAKAEGTYKPRESRPRTPKEKADQRTAIQTAAKKVLADLQGRKDELLRELKARVDSGVLLSPAWHGSPYEFDKFSTEKIGTGEGAQAYGYGLYFTDNKEIAEWYKERLSPPAIIFPDGQKFVGDEYQNIEDETKRTLAYYFLDHYKWHPSKDVYASVRTHIQQQLDYATRARNLSDIKKKQALLNLLNEWQKDGVKITSEGRLYDVELAPEEDEYLLWDKPLNEQNEQIKTIISKYAKQYNIDFDFETETGKTLYEDIASQMQTDENIKNGMIPNPPPFNQQEDASKYLLSLGIRGIKYLAGDSRAKGEGDYNYVIFDDKDITINQVLLSVAPPSNPLFEYGAMLLLDNMSKGKYTVDDFDADIQAITGKLTKDDLDTIHRESWAYRDALVKDMTEQMSRDRTQKKLGATATPDDIDAALEAEIEDKRESRANLTAHRQRTRATELNQKINDLAAQGGLDPSIIEGAKRFADMATPKAAQWMKEAQAADPQAKYEDLAPVMAQSIALLNQAKAEVKFDRFAKKVDAGGNLTREEIQEIQQQRKDAQKERSKARLELAKILQLYEKPLPTTFLGKSWELWLRANNLTRKFMLAAFQTAMNNIQGQVISTPMVAADKAFETLISKALRKVDRDNPTLSAVARRMIPDREDLIDPDTSPSDALRPIYYMAKFTRDTIDGVKWSKHNITEAALREHPYLHNEYYGTIASDVKKTRQLQRKGGFKYPHLALDKVDEKLDVVMTPMRLQEMNFRDAVFVGLTEAYLKAHGQSLEEVIRNNEFDTIPEPVMKRIVDSALEATGVAKKRGPITDFAKASAQVFPAAAHPMTFAGFASWATRFVLEHSPAVLGKAFTKKGLAGSDIAKMLTGALMWSLVVGLYAATHDDDDPWYIITLPFIKTKINIAGTFPLNFYYFTVHTIAQAVRGRETPPISEFVQAVTGYNTRYAEDNEMFRAAKGFGALYNSWRRGDEVKQAQVKHYLATTGKQVAGDTLGAFFTPLKTVKDIYAQFDSDEAIKRNLKAEPFLGAMKSKTPFWSQTLPPIEREGQPVRETAPALKQLGGVKVVGPAELQSPGLRAVKEYAEENFKRGLLDVPDEEKMKLIGDLKKRAKRGEDVKAEVEQLVKDEKISDTTARNILLGAKETELATAMREGRLTLTQAVEAYQRGSAADKKEMLPLIQEKILKKTNPLTEQEKQLLKVNGISIPEKPQKDTEIESAYPAHSRSRYNYDTPR